MQNFIYEDRLLDEYTLSLDQLYTTTRHIAQFKERYAQLCNDVPEIADICTLDNLTMHYESSSYVSQRRDPAKKNLVIVLGNPAPESLKLNALFAYESNKQRYHRFWNVLDETGILQFPRPPQNLMPEEKMDLLFSQQFLSPFNIFILPFYSFATPPGGPWAGVNGLKRLFSNAFAQIENYEIKKIHAFCQKYLRHDDIMLIFQKDAFICISPEEKNKGAKNKYDYRELLKAPIHTTIELNSENTINLMCMLPTRLLHAQSTKDALRRLAH